MGTAASCKRLTASPIRNKMCVQHLQPAMAAGDLCSSKTTSHHHHLSSIHHSSTTTKPTQGSDRTKRDGRDVPQRTNSLGHCGCNRDHCNGGTTLLEDAASLKLKLLLQQVDKGQMPQVTELRKIASLALEALSINQCDSATVKSEEERLESVRDRQVREWLSATFTRADSMYESHHEAATPIVKFKAAANTIIISQYFGSMRRDSFPNALQYTPALTQHLQHVDSWDFDMFSMEKVSDGQPLRYIAHQLLKNHNLFEKCGISVSRFDSFLVKIEEGYNRHGNPYHNVIHGADVAQTLHSMLVATRLKDVMSELEMLAVLLAALVHDVDHPGTTNNFHINQRSKYALLYNDRSVLENHHLYYAFSLLQEGNCNFLSGVSLEDYKVVRSLMIDMVLATDMSSHFDQLKHMRHIMSQPEAGSQLHGVERSKVFCLLLHMCDISHPGKAWELHHEWSVRLAEEFYRQGDREKKDALPISPLCDRNHGNLPTSQIGFIDFIVMPSYELCGDVLELLLSTPPVSPLSPQRNTTTPMATPPTAAVPFLPRRVWEANLTANRQRWQQQQQQADEGRGVGQTSVPTHQRNGNGTAGPVNGIAIGHQDKDATFDHYTTSSSSSSSSSSRSGSRESSRESSTETSSTDGRMGLAHAGIRRPIPLSNYTVTSICHQT